MASIHTGGSSSHGRRAVDAEIALVPFIDLLLCCVMFLLVTAVWNQMASVQADQPTPGGDEAAPTPVEPRLVLRIGQQGYVLGSDVGERVSIPKTGEAWDADALREQLGARRQIDPPDTRVVVAPDDGVHYETVVAAMDTVAGAGYLKVSLSDSVDL